MVRDFALGAVAVVALAAAARPAPPPPPFVHQPAPPPFVHQPAPPPGPFRQIGAAVLELADRAAGRIF